MYNECLTPERLDGWLCRGSEFRNIWLHPYLAHDVYEYLHDFCSQEAPSVITTREIGSYVGMLYVGVPDHILGKRYGVNILWDTDRDFLKFNDKDDSCAVVGELHDGTFVELEWFDATPPS